MYSALKPICLPRSCDPSNFSIRSPLRPQTGSAQPSFSAKLSALNCLSAIATVADLDSIRIVRVTGYVNAVPEFGDQPRVINGASELLQALYGENGRHARSAIGVGSLPTNASVEVEIIAERI